MEDRLHGLVIEEGDIVGLKVWLNLLGRNDKGEDKFFQSRVSSISIMEDLANVIDKLLDLPFLLDQYCAYHNRRHNKTKEEFFTTWVA